MPGQHVVIVGAGVVGVCCAYELAQRGVRVTLTDRAQVCSGCSFGNSGYIAPGHGPLCHPALTPFLNAPNTDPDAPFFVGEARSETMRDWLRRFRSACTHEHHEHCMAALGALGRDMVDRFSRLIERERLDCCYRAGGSAYVAFSTAAHAKTLDEGRELRAQGYAANDFTPEHMAAKAPGLRDDLAGSLFIALGASLNPRRFVLGLAERAAAMGVHMRQGEGVESVLTHAGRAAGVLLESGERIDADAVVITAGMQTPRLLAPLGVTLPMLAAKGFHVDLALEHIPFALPIVIADADIILTPMDGFVRVSGMVELTEDDTLCERRTDTMLRRALGFAPCLREGRPVSRWLGRRPCAPDGLPIVGAVPGVTHLHVATAHARLGLSLAPITGQVIAQSVLGEPAGIDISALRVDRF